MPNGKISKREIAEHPAQQLLPLTADYDVIFVEQYRRAVGKVLLEIPAGKLEKGEEPYNCAERELLEETNFIPGKMEYITKFIPAPASAMKLFICI